MTHSNTVRTRLALIALTAMAFAATSAVVDAQEKDDAAQAGQPERTVIGRSPTGAPIEELKVNHLVSYADLDLTTAAGVNELKRRVSEAAIAACEQLDSQVRLDVAYPDDAACRREAVSDAKDQVTAAVAAAQVGGAKRAS